MKDDTLWTALTLRLEKSNEIFSSICSDKWTMSEVHAVESNHKSIQFPERFESRDENESMLQWNLENCSQNQNNTCVVQPRLQIDYPEY